MTIKWDRTNHGPCISYMADALKRRDMLKEEAVLTSIKLTYERSSEYLTVIRIEFDGYLRNVSSWIILNLRLQNPENCFFLNHSQSTFTKSFSSLYFIYLRITPELQINCLSNIGLFSFSHSRIFSFPLFLLFLLYACDLFLHTSPFSILPYKPIWYLAAVVRLDHFGND